MVTDTSDYHDTNWQGRSLLTSDTTSTDTDTYLLLAKLHCTPFHRMYPILITWPNLSDLTRDGSCVLCIFVSHYPPFWFNILSTTKVNQCIVSNPPSSNIIQLVLSILLIFTLHVSAWTNFATVHMIFFIVVYLNEV